MDRHNVNKVAHFTVPGSGHDFVRRKVNRVQDIPESFILHNLEKAKLAIHNPFKMSSASLPGDFGCIYCWFAPDPSDAVTCRLKRLCIAGSG